MDEELRERWPLAWPRSDGRAGRRCLIEVLEEIRRLALPRRLVPVAEEWIGNYQRWLDAVEEISTINHELLRRGWVEDEQALRMVSRIEASIIPLDLLSQGQFITLTNALEMQLESGAPVPDVVRLLGDAILALAHARQLPSRTEADLQQRVKALNHRARSTSGSRR